MLFSYAISLTVLATIPNYAVLKKLPIGGDGGWDCLTMDSPNHRLFISRGTHVMVLDVNSGELVGDIPNTNGVHGIALVPKENKGYTSNGRDNTVTVFDLKTLKELKRFPVGKNPDVIFLDGPSNRVFCFNGSSNDATAIDPKSDTVVGTVKLDGKPEFPQSDGSGTIFVNIEDKSKIQKFDSKSLKVTGEWPVAPGEEPTGLGIDLRNHLLFSACGNNILAISDYKQGKVVGSAKIGSGPDGAGFDQQFGLAFTSNGQDGTMTVIGKGKNGFEAFQTVPTQASARTMAIDPKTHLIYMIAAEYKAPTGTNRRGQMVPGSATILVIGPTK
ncbi:MAG: YncE family protein [Armatimonadota bacterium]